ncbi:unnamed protein product [Rhizoctonia solani]|uniref:Uncharacterized protein n=1 Tax=Rhizoctonia solani TaxID=456999 RepID=A0A8H3I142_9AGAM|nr:unnamed protein product [Rhizoctonia solani]
METLRVTRQQTTREDPICSGQDLSCTGWWSGTFCPLAYSALGLPLPVACFQPSIVIWHSRWLSDRRKCLFIPYLPHIHQFCAYAWSTPGNLQGLRASWSPSVSRRG